MRTPPDILIILPVFNEAENIGGLICSIAELRYDCGVKITLLIVDDGSTDGSTELIEEYRLDNLQWISVVRHESNQGLGASIRDGLESARILGCNWNVIVTMDADESHCPGLILRMVQMIREGHDVVIASRYQPGSRVVGLSFGRRILSRASSLLLRLLAPIPGVRDYTCGYRAYRVEALQKTGNCYGGILVEETGFACQLEILLKMRPLSFVFGEVPLVLRYDRKASRSKMHVWKTAKSTLRMLGRWYA